MAAEPPIHSAHDRLFKEIFSHMEVARDFFQTHLPPRLAAALDWQTLRLVPGSFVDEHLASQASDLLYQVTWRDWPLYLYCLFEHQSTVDPDMPFRLLGYMVRIWDQHCRQNSRGARPPPILPIVLYQGPAAWTVSRQFLNWLAMPEELRAELLAQENRAAQFRTLLRYLFRADANAPSTFVDLVSRIENDTVKENVMSIADQLIQKGRQEGRQEGLQEGLTRGSLIGRIQNCQELLDLPVNEVTDLEQRDPRELEVLWHELQTELRRRLA